MTWRALLISLAASSVLAQQPVAPTSEAVGPVQGENKGNYNVVQSWETGYRFAEVGGNRGVYRADVNYGNGIRLLGSSLLVNSRNGKGTFFDEIVLNTQGLGNDPYESVVLRAQKNRLYRYDFHWRENDYYNPGLVTAGGLHLMDTQRFFQDHDLILFPQSRFKIRAGYSRNRQSGPALSSELLFDTRGSAVPLFADIKREFNEYRVGGDAEWRGWHLSALRRWEFYKEDTPYSLSGYTASGASVSSLRRSNPYHGETPSWLVSLLTERKRFAINGRFTYSAGRRNFIFDENAIGLDRFGASQNRQVYVFGDAQRPVATGDASVNIFATDKLTIVNNTSFFNTRISGNNSFTQFDSAQLNGTFLDFEFLGIRLVTNSTDARYQFTKQFTAYVGYQYSNRQIRSIQSGEALVSQDNQQHAGVAGFNWNPLKPLRVHFEGEIGRNDNPFVPVSERNYHAISARVLYKLKDVRLSAGYRQKYNNNSVTLSSYSSHARTYFADGSWNARPWLSLDASYSRLHLDTIGGIAFFAGAVRPVLVEGQQSVYVSNIHAANLGLRFAIRKRADLYVGYSITRDAGDGRASSVGPADPIAALLYSVQTFPLTFQSPLVRVSVPITQKIRFNVGYQYYGYHEDFGLFSVNQNYRANTGYTSILWSF